METKSFRILLVVNLLVVTAGFLGSFMTNDVVPSDVIEEAEKADCLFADEVPYVLRVILWLIIGMVLLLGLAGYIGMFFFWNVARYLFLVFVVLLISLNLTTKWSVATSLEIVFGEIEYVLDGVIISLAFFGPTKQFFKRNNSTMVELGETDETNTEQEIL